MTLDALVLASLARRRKRLLLGGVPSADTSSLEFDAFEQDADGVATNPYTGTVLSAVGLPVVGKVMVVEVDEMTSVSPSLSTVTVDRSTMVADDVEVATFTVTLVDAEGHPIANLPANRIVLAVSGTGNTLVQPASATNGAGVTQCSFTTSVDEVKTPTITVYGVALDDQPPVTAEAAGATPDIEVDFDDYANIGAVDADSGSGLTFAAEESGGPWSQFARQSLATSIGGAKALRFNYPDRTTFVAPDYPDGADSLRCADFYIIRAMTKFFTDNAPVTECWAELTMAWSGPLGESATAFTTAVPSGWGCVSGSDHKTIFLTTTSTRFSWKVGYAGLYYPAASSVAIPEGPLATRIRWDPTAPGQGDGDNNFIGPNVWDGLLHTIRVYAKVDPSGSTGRQMLWVDGVELYDSGGINTPSQTSINKLSLGNNLNRGANRDMHMEFYGIKLYINGNDPGW